MAFNDGDLVKLKSGGPVMTVEATDGTDIYCMWFIDHKVEKGVFREPTLEAYNEPSRR